MSVLHVIWYFSMVKYFNVSKCSCDLMEGVINFYLFKNKLIVYIVTFVLFLFQVNLHKINIHFLQLAEIK